jgi:predicted nucleic acid-binding protein
VRACLDAFALMVWLNHELGWERVREAMEAGETSGAPTCVMSAVNLGEVFYILHRRVGSREAQELWWSVVSGELPIDVVDATAPRVLRAAGIKARARISYADAFACATALEHSVPLLTGDPEIVGAREELGIEIITLI